MFAQMDNFFGKCTYVLQNVFHNLELFHSIEIDPPDPPMAKLKYIGIDNFIKVFKDCSDFR